MVLKRRPGWHAHNVFLQAWFEFGLLGVVLAAALSVALIRSIGHFRGELQPYGCALAGAALAVASFGWGMWQTWLMSVFATAIALMHLAQSIQGPIRQPPKRVPDVSHGR